METPTIDHLTVSDYLQVYEPAQDTFFLLDAIESDLDFLEKLQPKICVEIGSGSGLIITAIAKQFKNSFCMSTDINKFACNVTKRTSIRNNTCVNPICMNLVDCLRENIIDLLVFNPPYVVTTDEELNTTTLTKDGITKGNLVYTWAGGLDGRRIIDMLVNDLQKILSPHGVMYLLVLKENKPEEIVNSIIFKGFNCSKFMERRIPGEYLYVLKISQK